MLTSPNDFVNGMSAVVLSFDHHKQAILVETETRQRLCVYPITTDEGAWRTSHVLPGEAGLCGHRPQVPRRRAGVTSPSGRTGLDARPPAMWLCHVCEKTWTICWAGASKRSTSFQLAEKIVSVVHVHAVVYKAGICPCTMKAHFLGIM